MPELNRQAEGIDEEMRRLEGRIRDVEAQINALNLDREYAIGKIEENRELIKSLDEKKASHRQRVDELTAKIKELEIVLTEKQARESELVKELKDMQQQRLGMQNEYALSKKQFESARTRFEESSRQLMAIEATQAVLVEQVTELSSELLRRGIEETDDVPGSEAVRIRIASIEKAMERLEPVNMRAIDEFNEVGARLEDLRSRRDTLFNEREQILERIKQYEVLKKMLLWKRIMGSIRPSRKSSMNFRMVLESLYWMTRRNRSTEA